MVGIPYGSVERIWQKWLSRRDQLKYQFAAICRLSSNTWLLIVPSCFCASVLTRAYSAAFVIYVELIPEDRPVVESSAVDSGAAGHVLVKEYIDDGLSGTQLDRPGLDEMRKDIKTGVFEAIYFLDTDRIARDVAYQSIILSELLKYGKQIIIKGKDYVNNSENKLTLTMLGAFAEFERAKIIERTSRGRLHRLRMGEPGVVPHRDPAVLG
jgi:Resolvase, N terminal domain